MAKKTHIPTAGATITYCGILLLYSDALVIDLKRESIESATCGNCRRVDDSRVIKNHARECRDAGIDPNTLEPIPGRKKEATNVRRS